MNVRRMLTVALTMGAAALIGGCGSSAPTEAEHNAADVTFATQMIPHHAQAVEMAEAAPSKA